MSKKTVTLEEGKLKGPLSPPRGGEGASEVRSTSASNGTSLLTFLLPPTMSIFQSMKSSLMYCKYLIPFMCSMSFYVTGVSSYSTLGGSETRWVRRR